MKRLIVLLAFVSFAIIPSCLMGSEEELYFTYAGAMAGYGTNQVAYRGWSSKTNERFSTVIDGNFFGGGFMLGIFVKNYVGEFTLEYVNDSMAEDYASIQHLLYTTSFKYAFYFNNVFGVTAGIGCYLETPPADKGYDAGGGINGTLGTVFGLGRDFKIIADAVCRYGRFGLGDDSSKLSIGGKLGVVYKVGRI